MWNGPLGDAEHVVIDRFGCAPSEMGELPVQVKKICISQSVILKKNFEVQVFLAHRSIVLLISLH